MRIHGHTTSRSPTGGWSPAQATDRGRRFVLAVTLLAMDPGLAAVRVAGDRGDQDAAGRAAGPARLGGRRGHPAASPVLARFLRQKTVLVTTYRRDGRPVSTPVSLAVDGDHAYLRSFEQAGKTRHIRHNPRVEVSPSTAQGRVTGPAIQATARPLEGAESRRAARLLAHKHPVLHGVLVPLTHRLGRANTSTTVHFQLTPRDPGQVQ